MDYSDMHMTDRPALAITTMAGCPERLFANDAATPAQKDGSLGKNALSCRPGYSGLTTADVGGKRRRQAAFPADGPSSTTQAPYVKRICQASLQGGQGASVPKDESPSLDVPLGLQVSPPAQRGRCRYGAAATLPAAPINAPTAHPKDSAHEKVRLHRTGGLVNDGLLMRGHASVAQMAAASTSASSLRPIDGLTQRFQARHPLQLQSRWQASSSAVAEAASQPASRPSHAGTGSSSGTDGSASDTSRSQAISELGGSVVPCSDVEGGAGGDLRPAADGGSQGDGCGPAARELDVRGVCTTLGLSAFGATAVPGLNSSCGVWSAEDDVRPREQLNVAQQQTSRDADVAEGRRPDGETGTDAAAVRDSVLAAGPSGPVACDALTGPPGGQTVSAHLGAALPPEMAARLRKKIIIIQPISRAWVEETLQTSSGTNVSGMSGGTQSGGTGTTPAAAEAGQAAANTSPGNVPDRQGGKRDPHRPKHSKPAAKADGHGTPACTPGEGEGSKPRRSREARPQDQAFQAGEEVTGLGRTWTGAQDAGMGGKAVVTTASVSVPSQVACPERSRQDDSRGTGAWEAGGKAPMPASLTGPVKQPPSLLESQLMGGVQGLAGGGNRLQALAELIAAAKLTGSGPATAAAAPSPAPQRATLTSQHAAVPLPSLAALIADSISPFCAAPLALLGPALATSSSATTTVACGAMLPPKHGSSASTGITASAATGTLATTTGTATIPDQLAFGSTIVLAGSGSGIRLPGLGSGVLVPGAGSGVLLPWSGSGAASRSGNLDSRQQAGLVAATPTGSAIQGSLAAGPGGGASASTQVTAGASLGTAGLRPAAAGGAAGPAAEMRSKSATPWALLPSGLLPPPPPPPQLGGQYSAQQQQQPPSSACLGRVQGELTLLYQWYVANKNLYLDQAQRQLQRVEALTAAVTVASGAAAADGTEPAGATGLDAATAATVRAESAEALRAFETALKIMRVCGSVEQQWLLPPPPATATAPALGSSDRPALVASPGVVSATLLPASAPADLGAAAAAAPDGLRGVQGGGLGGGLLASVLHAGASGPPPVPASGWAHGASAALAVAAALVGSVARRGPQHGASVEGSLGAIGTGQVATAADTAFARMGGPLLGPAAAGVLRGVAPDAIAGEGCSARAAAAGALGLPGPQAMGQDPSGSALGPPRLGSSKRLGSLPPAGLMPFDQPAAAMA